MPPIGEVVEQRVRGLSRAAAVEVPGVVLDAVAEAHLGEHLEIETRALIEPLQLDQLLLRLELLETPGQLLLDGPHGRLHGLLARHVVAGRVDGGAAYPPHHGSPQGIDLRDRLHVIPEELHPHCQIPLVGREDL
jgi:hypothetical protein